MTADRLRPVPLKLGSTPKLWSWWTDPSGTTHLVTGAFATGVIDRPDLILCESPNGGVVKVGRAEMLRDWRSSSRP